MRLIVAISLLIFLFGCAHTSVENRIESYPPELELVSDYVNNEFLYVSDDLLFGVVDYWQLPEKFLYETKMGDCEDQAMAKAYLLVTTYNYPTSSVSILIVENVITKVQHVVLLVKGSKCILDNLTAKCRTWKDLERDGYRLMLKVTYADYIKFDFKRKRRQ